jgi:dolichol-phosphate mannosyltransferase
MQRSSSDTKASSRPHRVYIGLPAYNEEIALPRLLERVARLIAGSKEVISVVVYNDGSTDRTLSIAREWQARLPLVALDGVRNCGLGAGLRALIEHVVAHGGDDDALVIMDCDDTHDPSQIDDILDNMTAGADVVIASRYARNALIRGVPLFRRATAIGALVLFKLIYPIRGVWDYTCGYRGYRIGALKAASARYGAGLIRESGFACMVEILLKLKALGVRISEIPLQLRYDQKPTASKMDVGANISRLLTLLVRWRVHGFDAQ